MAIISPIKNGDWASVRQAIAILSSQKLGVTSSPTFAGLTITGTTTIEGLDPSELLATDDASGLTTVADGEPGQSLMTSGTGYEWQWIRVHGGDAQGRGAVSGFHGGTSAAHSSLIGLFGGKAI